MANEKHQTVLVLFGDGNEYFFPCEVIEEQLSTWSDAEREREIGLCALRGLISRLKGGKETNVYDMLALKSNRWYTCTLRTALLSSSQFLSFSLCISSWTS